MRKLPPADRFGNRWLGRHGNGQADDPAIFPSKRLCDGCVVFDGTYLVFLGGMFGFVVEGNGLKRYMTEADALDEVNRRRL